MTWPTRLVLLNSIGCPSGLQPDSWRATLAGPGEPGSVASLPHHRLRVWSGAPGSAGAGLYPPVLPISIETRFHVLRRG